MISTQWIEKALRRLPQTAQMRVFGITQIPLLFLVNPTVIKLDDTGSEIKIPLSYVTKNHLGSMYFGAMGIGADTAVGFLAVHMMRAYPEVNIVLVFSSFHMDFLKRAEADVIFKCTAHEQVRAMVEKVVSTGERVSENIPVEAIAAGEVVAKGYLGLSLKAKPKK